MKRLLFRFVVNAFALWLCAYLIPGIRLTGGWTGLALAALVFGIVNAFIKPIVMFFSFPFLLLTLGLFTIVINAAMLALTDFLSDGIEVTQFVAFFLGAVLISVVSFVLSLFASDDKK